MGNRSIRRGERASMMVALGLGCGAMVSVNAAQNTDQLEEVIVTGIRASLGDSIEAKKEGDHVAEVISADNIGQMPNVTVAESLVRLPGINGARDRGNESLATVRGLGPRLTMGTVNGREIASSEPNRNVRWEVFPTEVVSTVKVYKSQSADLISGGVAGTIDIGTVRPLDYGGPALVASAGAAYYDQGKSIPGYDSWGNRFGASWVGKVSDNLAFALGGTLQDQKNAYPSMGSWGYTDASNAQDVDGDGDLDPTPWGAATEVKQLDQSRNGVVRRDAMALGQLRNESRRSVLQSGDRREAEPDVVPGPRLQHLLGRQRLHHARLLVHDHRWRRRRRNPGEFVQSHGPRRGPVHRGQAPERGRPQSRLARRHVGRRLRPFVLAGRSAKTSGKRSTW